MTGGWAFALCGAADGAHGERMNERERAELACALVAPVVETSAIERARALTSPSDDDALVVALLELVQLIEEREATSVVLVRVMTALERISDIDAVVGGRLMAARYPHADRAHAHAVCDGIELWIDAARSGELADIFDEFGHCPADPSQRARYARWAGSIRER